jgi:hypothetical protein
MTRISNRSELDVADRMLLSPVNRHKLTCLLQRVLGTSEFLSPYGMRALSRYHKRALKCCGIPSWRRLIRL